MADGGWTGSDAQVRLLRTVTAFVLLSAFVYVVLDRRDIGTIGTILGALLVDLAFEVQARWLGGPK